MREKTYRIGELSKLVGISIETIRYYETQRLVPKATRSIGNYRLYSEEGRERLIFIHHCRLLDMTLAEIKELLRAKDDPTSPHCASVTTVIDEHIEHVARRVAELKQLQTDLKNLRQRCRVTEDQGQCTIIKQLSTRHEIKRKQAIRGEIGGAHRRVPK